MFSARRGAPASFLSVPSARAAIPSPPANSTAHPPATPPLLPSLLLLQLSLVARALAAGDLVEVRAVDADYRGGWILARVLQVGRCCCCCCCCCCCADAVLGCWAAAVLGSCWLLAGLADGWVMAGQCSAADERWMSGLADWLLQWPLLSPPAPDAAAPPAARAAACCCRRRRTTTRLRGVLCGLNTAISEKREKVGAHLVNTAAAVIACSKLRAGVYMWGKRLPAAAVVLKAPPHHVCLPRLPQTPTLASGCPSFTPQVGPQAWLAGRCAAPCSC